MCSALFNSTMVTPDRFFGCLSCASLERCGKHAANKAYMDLGPLHGMGEIVERVRSLGPTLTTIILPKAAAAFRFLSDALGRTIVVGTEKRSNWRSPEQSLARRECAYGGPKCNFSCRNAEVFSYSKVFVGGQSSPYHSAIRCVM